MPSFAPMKPVLQSTTKSAGARRDACKAWLLHGFHAVLLLDDLPHARRRKRQLPHLDVERTQRRCDRVRNNAADGDDSTLACAFGAKRIVRRWVIFQRDDADV